MPPLFIIVLPEIGSEPLLPEPALPALFKPQKHIHAEDLPGNMKLEHGAPLRLASATKYGIKQIKRIGRIEYTADRPRDYWAEEGYDWYAGH